ncbi:transglutaminase family protein [Chloroflexota bacterium]
MYTNNQPLAFYAAHSLMSDPREHTDMFSDLPEDIPALSKIVQGLLIHQGWASSYGVSIPPDREMEPGIRMVSDKLDRIQQLDNRLLTETRPPKKRLVSICRDFALMLTALLRQNGVPARVRYGFATYFFPPDVEEVYADHVITEYWHAGDRRWMLVDPQLDELQYEAIQAAFDPCDIPRELFLTGGAAWKRCQNGEVNPNRFGFFPDFTGLWYVKGHLARDFAALNKVEMQCWDYWGLFERRDSDLSVDDLMLLNRAAELSTAGNKAFDELRSFYTRDMRLRVPPIVKSWYVEDSETYRLKEFLGEDLSLAKYL